jgi:hypothetical protein
MVVKIEMFDLPAFVEIFYFQMVIVNDLMNAAF